MVVLAARKLRVPLLPAGVAHQQQLAWQWAPLQEDGAPPLLPLPCLQELLAPLVWVPHTQRCSPPLVWVLLRW